MLSAGETSVETTPEAGSVTISDIVSDTDTGGSAYEGQILTLNATIRSVFQVSDGMTLVSGNDNVTFFVASYGTRERLADYQADEEHTLTLYIHEQAPDTINNDGSYNVWTHLVANAEAETVTIGTLNAHAKAENQEYQGSVITLTATVSTVGESSIFLKGNELGVGIYIKRSGHPTEAEYQENQTYTFTLFVIKIGAWVVGSEARLGLIRSE